MFKRTVLLVVLALALALVAPGVLLAARGGQPGPPAGSAAAERWAERHTEQHARAEAGEEGLEEGEDVDTEGGPDHPVGIANAAERIAANIAKAEMKLAAGKRKHVPQGLLSVFAKFSLWLEDGMPDDSTPESETVEPEETQEPLEDPAPEVD